MVHDPVRERLAQLLPELMGLLHAAIAGDTLAIMHDANLTMPQLVSLHIVRHHDGMRISDLGVALGLSTSASSAMVDRMVERGLFLRTEDPADRRQKRIAIAADGVALIDRLAAARATELAAGLAHVDPAVRAELADVLEQAVRQLRARQPRGGATTSTACT
ncbi:MAG: hypothetical protein RLZZ299_1389 [Pseudomonadota bacterium]